MIKKINRLLIIPARANSKRIKNKNIKIFCGHPIIYYSLQTAIKSKLFTKIHVSTDSDKIVKILKKYNFIVDFKRPEKISTNYTQVIDVLRYVVDKYKEKGFEFDEIWSLSACAPLIEVKDLLSSAKLMIGNKNKILLPVTEYSAPIEWAFNFKKNNYLKPIKPGFYKKRSQDLEKKYHDTGAFICIPKKFLSKKITLLDQHYLGKIIPKSRSVDIDDIEDWKLAESLYKKK
jgi:CMP-N-acetylneuraminic acid synthetase